jgi:hypothetical protein
VQRHRLVARPVSAASSDAVWACRKLFRLARLLAGTRTGLTLNEMAGGSETRTAVRTGVAARTSTRISRVRRLIIRYEQRIDIHPAFAAIACTLPRLNALRQRF